MADCVCREKCVEQCREKHAENGWQVVYAEKNYAEDGWQIVHAEKEYAENAWQIQGGKDEKAFG